MRKLTVILIVAAAVHGRSYGQLRPYAYQAAMYTSISGVSSELEVFPLAAKPFSIRIPFALGVFTFSRDGKALYASALERTMPGLFKIDLGSAQANAVPGSAGLGLDDLAVSTDQGKIVVAGGRLGTPCGIFELNVMSGDVKTVVSSSPCDPLNPLVHWMELSVSRDGTRATARRNQHLEFINLATGKVEHLVDGFEEGEWSPDGKWYAAVDSTGETVLLDSNTFAQRRRLGSTDLTWSPDSRYLLNKKRDVGCWLSEMGTLEMVNVETGKRTAIESSRCLVDRKAGCVSADIKPRPSGPVH